MPYCPHCLTDYRPGVAACADCGAALVEQLADDPAGEALEAICQAEGGREAAEIRALLERSGIRTLLDRDLVKVSRGDAERALDLIKGFFAAGDDADLVPVYEAPDRFLATTIESLLQHEGISATVQSRQMPMYDGLAMMQHPVWGRVLVLAPDAGRARAIVRTFLDATAALDQPDQPPPACPSCGTDLRPGARYCDRCGAQLAGQ
ncbi:MAG: DUF2007 domain-containing protein [Candidatus Edwardsbacteria bacterium]|jgi:hypothetical protein|nr:DUF2007 domain-containing protein [Candidatus Edwardsbacteria bacterium]